jgi:cation transport ATPase
MLPPDDSTQTTGSSERTSRPYNRRDSLSERRQNILHQKQTDTLPAVNNEAPNGRIAWRQLIQLREENKRLRWELAEFEGEIEAIHSGHQQEIEQYQNHLQSLMEERDSLKESHYQLERRYQELYHDFHNTVEEEAQKMVQEAARTIVLSPESRPAMMNDAMRTVELHVRQVEDERTAEALYLMRQAQRKAKEMEQELANERQQIEAERQNFQNLHNSIREQAKLRKRVVEQHLRARYMFSIMLITTVLLLLLPVFQIMLLSALHIKMPPGIYLFAPIVLCLLLAGFFSYAFSSARVLAANTRHKRDEKAAAKGNPTSQGPKKSS